MADTGPMARRLEVAALLRARRVHLGLTAAELASRVDMSPAKLSRLERGERGIQVNDVRALAGALALTDEETDHLLTLTRASRMPGWWSEFSDLDDAAPMLYGLEQDAVELKSFETLRIPGLLQLEAYARALIGQFRPGRSDHLELVEARVSARIRRQAVLERRERLFHFVIDEAAVRRAIGSPSVMVEQISRVMDVAHEPNVTVQVLPFRSGAHAGMSGSFLLLTFAQDLLPDTVFVENLVKSTFLDDEPNATLYREVFDSLRDVAASPEVSLEILESSRAEWMREAGEA